MVDITGCTKSRQVWRMVCPDCDSDNTTTQPAGPDIEVKCHDCGCTPYRDRG